MKKSIALALLGLLTFKLALMETIALGQEAKSPNILIFMMDDMGYGDINVLNPDGAGFATPNLDALVEQGVTFTHAHSSASVCACLLYTSDAADE